MMVHLQICHNKYLFVCAFSIQILYNSQNEHIPDVVLPMPGGPDSKTARNCDPSPSIFDFDLKYAARSGKVDIDKRMLYKNLLSL